MNHGPDFRINKSECMRAKCIVARFHPHLPNCDTGSIAKDQESRTMEPRTMQEGAKDNACMGRGQEPRTKEQESPGPRTKDHAGAKDHDGVEMISSRMSSACMRQTRQTRGPARHAGIPMHAWRAILYPRIESILQAGKPDNGGAR